MSSVALEITSPKRRRNERRHGDRQAKSLIKQNFAVGDMTCQRPAGKSPHVQHPRDRLVRGNNTQGRQRQRWRQMDKKPMSESERRAVT